MAKVVQTTLQIAEANVEQYCIADGLSLNTGGYAIRLYLNGHTYGSAILNDAAKEVLYPSATAHPLKIDSFIRANKSGGSMTISLQFDGTSVDSETGSWGTGLKDKTKEGISDPVIINSSRSTEIKWHIKGSSTVSRFSIASTRLTFYFNQYEMRPLIGNDANGIQEATVSNASPYQGDTVVFTPKLVQGATWVGWYSDAACTNLVSTDQNYSVSPTSDLTLYAKATHNAELFTCAAVAGANISSVSTSDSTVPANSSCTFSAAANAGCIFDGWYSDKSYTNLVSTANPYVATIIANTTLYAKAHLSKLNISVGQAEHGTASVNASVITYGDKAIFTFNPESDDYKLYGWYADEGLTQLVSEDNPYTCTPTTDYKLYPKTDFIRYTIKFTKTQNIILYTSFTLKAVSYFSDRISGKDLALLHAGKFDQVDSNSIFSTKSASGTVVGSELSVSIQAPKNTKVILYVTSTNNGDGCECICSTGEYSENTRLTNCGYYDFQPTKDVEYYANIKKYKCVCTGIPKDGVDYTDVSSPVIQETNAIFLAGLKSDYIFKGWYSDSNCTKLVSSDNPASIATPKYTGDTGSATSLTLYALGEKATFTRPTIYFKSGGSYVAATKVYKKVSGAWVKQTDLPAIFSGESSGTASNYVYGGSV